MKSNVARVLFVVALVLGSSDRVLAQSAAVHSQDVTAIQEHSMQAVVDAVDKRARTLTLRRSGGESVTLNVPADVLNFEQIEPGDQVRADYRETVVISRLSSGAATKTRDDSELTVSAPGQKPAASWRRTIEITAAITRVDVAKGLVTLRGPQGNERTIHVDPDSTARIGELKIGDAVAMRYTEATVVAVERAAP